MNEERRMVDKKKETKLKQNEVERKTIEKKTQKNERNHEEEKRGVVDKCSGIVSSILSGRHVTLAFEVILNK